MLADGEKLLKKARDDLEMPMAMVNMIHQNVTLILNLYVCCSKYLQYGP